jgi:hypothetical protein
MAQESLSSLKTKIIELFGNNQAISVKDMEQIMDAVVDLEKILVTEAERTPQKSMAEIDAILYSHAELDTEPVKIDGGPSIEMQTTLASSRKLSATRIDWACAYGRVAKTKEELDYLISRERTMRYMLDNIIR